MMTQNLGDREAVIHAESTYATRFAPNRDLDSLRSIFHFFFLQYLAWREPPPKTATRFVFRDLKNIQNSAQLTNLFSEQKLGMQSFWTYHITLGEILF